MSDSHVYSALSSKRSQIERAMAEYESRLSKASADLEAVSAAMALFASDGKRLSTPYKALRRLFGPRELMAICKASLASEGQLGTRELAIRVMAAKGMDTGDLELQTAIVKRLANILHMQAKRGSLRAIRRAGRPQLWAGE